MIVTKRQYFVSLNGSGFAAWPLHSPAWPKYGQWSWLDLKVGQPAQFIRSLSDLEVLIIYQQYTIWGMKLQGEPWALVQGCRNRSGTAVSLQPRDPRYSVGV